MGGAEFSNWVKKAGIPCSHMMDVWLTRGDSKQETLNNLSAIKSILEPVGLTFDPDKDGCSQQLVFLGVLIDTHGLNEAPIRSSPSKNSFSLT